MGLVVESRSADVGRRRALEQPLLLGMAVEAGHCAQPTGDRCPGASAGLQVAGEGLDVRTARREQADVVLLAPGDELAQIQGIGIAGQSAVAGEERGKRVPLKAGELGFDDSDFGRRRSGRGAPPARAETWRPEPPGPSCVFVRSTTYARSVASAAAIGCRPERPERRFCAWPGRRSEERRPPGDGSYARWRGARGPRWFEAPAGAGPAQIGTLLLLPVAGTAASEV